MNSTRGLKAKEILKHTIGAHTSRIMFQSITKLEKDMETGYTQE